MMNIKRFLGRFEKNDMGKHSCNVFVSCAYNQNQIVI